MILRQYQLKAVQSTFNYLAENKGKNPVLVLPTGAGKSICLAAFISSALEWWPGIKILVVTHQKELIEQDARALHNAAPDLSIGIYSALLKSKDVSQSVTFASIQSIYRISVPGLKFIIIDEAHLINNEAQGMYRKFFERNSGARIIGLTATPYRLGQGFLTDGEDSIFDDLIEPVSILELQGMGYLAKLRSKGTFTKLDLTNIKLRGGEFVERDLQNELDTYTTNEAVCQEIARSADYYKRSHILIFCSGVNHAMHVAEILSGMGMKADYITGAMKQDEREEKLYSFTHGYTEALCNANLLTTGFDYPDIDMIAMLRPTMSPGLYLQMAGRGLRLKSNGGDCLVLDFAGNVQRHGPVAFVAPPKKKGEKRDGVQPCKECPECLEIVPVQVSVCPNCGHEFPRNPYTWVLYDGDINGDGLEKHQPWMWRWMVTESREKHTPMVVCEFRVENSESIRMFFFPWHERLGQRDIRRLLDIAKNANAAISDDWYIFVENIQNGERPEYIITKRDEKNRKYRKVVKMLWKIEMDGIRAEYEKEKEAVENARRSMFKHELS